jgi:uncharacterized protein (TIGR03083 family)
MSRYDQLRIRTALLAQADALGEWLSGLDDGAWAAPSVLPDWTVAVLAGHVAGVLRSATTLLARPTPDRPRPLAEHLPPDVGVPNDDDRVEELTDWGGAAPADVLAAYRDAGAAARDTLASGPLPAAVTISRGPAAVADVLLTRVWELVIHSDDLARSLPDRPGPRVEPGAVPVTARGLADLLAARTPGHSVELRVPPYVAVQCVPGPRHTRGTPPSVVETDPTTWWRLATGRTGWADAVATGAVRASGERSDLSGYLPVLA